MPIKPWWQGEARIGRQNKLTRRWARRGTRPSTPRDQHRSSTWIFGAIYPAEGKAVGIIMPRPNSEAMSMHLEETAFHVAPGVHAVVILNQAGWHGSVELVACPISIVAAVAAMPGAQRGRSVWQSMRDNWLLNRICKSYDDIVERCYFTWNNLVSQICRIKSIGMRP